MPMEGKQIASLQDYHYQLTAIRSNTELVSCAFRSILMIA